MDNSSSPNNDGVINRKRDNSELSNGIVLSKVIKMDPSPYNLPKIVPKTKLHGVSQSFSLDNTKLEILSESTDPFQKLIVNNNGDVEQLSLTEFQVLSPVSNSVYSDDVGSPDLSEPVSLISDNELSPDIIDGSELKKNAKIDMPIYVPISRYSDIQESSESGGMATWSRYRNINHMPIPLNDRLCTIPELPWGNRTTFWKNICDKDSVTLTYRNPDYNDYNEELRPRMRAILLDWLYGVSSVYNLHRETYYLAMDYLDRYLSNSDSNKKDKLQLFGITCLFIAAKVEEIYPPKLRHFAFMTDGSCTEDDMLETEGILMSYLRFRLTPISTNYWLELMLQFICVEDSTSEDSLIIAQYPTHIFNQMALLLDFATLDLTCLNFSYGVLAASALYIVLNKNIALAVSGLSEGNLCICVEWMTVYWSLILEQCDYENIDIRQDLIGVDCTRFQQQRLFNLDMYDLVQTRFELIKSSKFKNPIAPSNLLTPPWSGRKTPGTIEDCKPSCS